MRRDYAAGGLAEADLEPEPVPMFRRWLREATDAGLHEPNAMVVATADAEGTPSARLVLLKGLDERGFVFFTNYRSRKGTELSAHPACALLFPWHDLERQVRVDGRAAPLGEEENIAYFRSRPRASQIGAWASPQSSVVASREELDAGYAATEERFAEVEEIPLPPSWGGFRVAPEAVEFWQGRRGRMHDRLRYRRAGARDGDAGWVVERLAP
ncbi:pyridoxamine 5'-phosphate oxidase [Nocardioides mesophilus]|uniref:Pyridoxine/pyridoxamine 5'-phosphate oxidase n=1 Tax=Nocardioides mesophilus TaxID=433659 RepID=A0A7G9RHF9_9ACTN|nr:pyridoxamine 5'-phosphate oxidase [Nocardioides mesophilus]